MATNYIAIAKKAAMEHTLVLNYYAHLTKAMEQDNEPPKVVLAFKVQEERVLCYLVAWGQGPLSNF